MSDETQGHGDVSGGATALIRDADGGAYAVPMAVLEAHRLTPERRAALEAELREAAGYSAESGPPADADIYPLTREELAPYRLSDEAQSGDGADVQGFGQYIGEFVMWNPPTRVQNKMMAALFGSYTTDPGYIITQNLARSDPYPGLR